MPTSTSHDSSVPASTRRRFLGMGGGAMAASALSGVTLPHVHAASDNAIRLAIIGCGPRGTGAVGDALSSANGPCKLIAMGDLFEDKLNKAHKALSDEYPDRVDVPPERRFLGFDAYKRVMDCLRPGDIALLTTRAAFRPTHLDHAVAKGVNIFMEKSFAADPGGIKRVLKAGKAAAAKNLKIACGLQCRHSIARQEMIGKIRDGAMGELIMIRAYRMQGGGMMGPRKPDADELLWQIRQPVALLWSAGGKWMENMIHQVDECCWLKDSWPVSAHGLGGRPPHSTDCSQNLDDYSIEYTFGDGSKALVNGRFWPKCHNEFATFVHGSKCAGQFSGETHAATVQIYKDQRVGREHVAWAPEKEKISPWQAEWDNFLDAVKKDRPYNEVERSALANLAAIMGRAAVHSGRIITWEEAMASEFRFCDVDALTPTSQPPIMPDDLGRYPAPVPGQWIEI